MAFLELAGQRLAIRPGESVIGSDAASAIRVTGSGVLPRHAYLQATPDGQIVIRRADNAAELRINGVRLGPQPTPLLHGDKIEMGTHELLFVDERRSGSTQYMQAMPGGAAGSAPGRAVERKPTAATGGRVVSLTDGREYFVQRSLVIGRDASCDVVVTNKDVSRRHAEIVTTATGYIVVDSSTNGTFVNGQRVNGQMVLARADVIRVGTSEFRFYADTAAAAPAAAPAGPSPSLAAPGALRRLADTLMGVRTARPSAPPGSAPPAPHAPAARSAPPAPPAPAPAAPAASAPPAQPVPPAPAAAARPSAGHALAHLVVRSGTLKGQRLPLRTPVVNVGRADYNDLVIPDDSVSTVHAKFQRREGIWILVDLDSTNGSFVDGERIAGEAPLAPGALVRFGEVRAFFEPADQDEPVKGGSTKLIQALKLPTDKP
jgi:pSer/pThr/pTyr-binding forkhead associated (FHA) protein